MKTKTHLQNHSSNGDSSESCSPSPSPSPPSSPRRPSRAPHCRRRHHTKAQAISDIFVGFLFRRCVRAFLLLPLFYISGVLMCVGTFSFLSRPPPLPGSVYRSDEVFRELWPMMQSDNASSIELTTVWKHRRRLEAQMPCTNNITKHAGSRAPSGYLVIEANGGLNQQRSSICNAVALAGLLDAVLVIPKFNFHSIWKDPSEFKDIFDEEHFIRTLQGHVRVVTELPETLMEKYDHNISNIPNFRVNAWASASYYLETVYPILQSQGVIRITPFANRLAMAVPPNIQCLRCLANYKSLQFAAPIDGLAKELVNRMIEKSSRTDGKYVSVHLRFEEDMVAFSCCEYNGGRAEKREMKSAREKGWKKFNQKDRIIRPGLNRMNGRCPMSPVEVGMMLRGMGFDENTPIYLASGKIYNAKRYLTPLLQMFPLLQTKESLARPEELAPFEGYLSRMAALDYTVCLFSEVFVTTQGGNFPHFLVGHRRHLYNGHAKTIKPDKRKMVLLLHNTTISWEVFKRQMKAMLVESDRRGISLGKPKESVYAQPLPECTCCGTNSAHAFSYSFESIHSL